MQSLSAATAAAVAWHFDLGEVVAQTAAWRAPNSVLVAVTRYMYF
jgi:hypothetical protein